jgi:hypothetical protein
MGGSVGEVARVIGPANVKVQHVGTVVRDRAGRNWRVAKG